MNFCRFGLSPSISGSREMPCRCKQRCNEDRGRRGMEGCRAYKKSSSGSKVRRRKATIIASSSLLRTVDLGSFGPVFNRLALSPFGNSFHVDARLAAQFCARSLRLLYCNSDGVRRRGAAVTYLSHKAPFHSIEWIAPSNLRIKQAV